MPGHVPETLFSVPAVVRFPKNRVNIIERDTNIADETFCIDLYLTSKIPTY